MRRYLSTVLLREYGTHFCTPAQTVRPLFATPVYWTTHFTPEDAFAYLGLSTNSSPEECRDAYLKLARQLHPDCKPDRSSSEFTSDSVHSDHAPFQRLQEAYEVASKAAATAAAAQSAQSHRASSCEPIHAPEPIVRHRAPQHRQFLEAESLWNNCGPSMAGLSPAERHRQVQMQRFAEAAYASADYRVARVCSNLQTERCVAVPNDEHHRRRTQIKSTNFIERVADELIQEAINRGEFDQLPGQGKPLPQESHTDLFADPATAKITRILVNQGYLPEWVQLGKEIRDRWDKAVTKLDRIANSSKLRNAALNEFREEVRKINRIIDRYNLLVPALHLQRGHKNADQFLNEMHTARAKRAEKQSPSPAPPPPPSVPITDSEMTKADAEDESIDQTPKAEQSPKQPSQGDGSESGNLWDPRYLAEITRDFYRELARAYVSMMRGFKNHR